jgi:hypothetical protein
MNEAMVIGIQQAIGWAIGWAIRQGKSGDQGDREGVIQR